MTFRQFAVIAAEVLLTLVLLGGFVIFLYVPENNQLMLGRIIEGLAAVLVLLWLLLMERPHRDDDAERKQRIAKLIKKLKNTPETILFALGVHIAEIAGFKKALICSLIMMAAPVLTFIGVFTGFLAHVITALIALLGLGLLFSALLIRNV